MIVKNAARVMIITLLSAFVVSKKGALSRGGWRVLQFENFADTRGNFFEEGAFSRRGAYSRINGSQVFRYGLIVCSHRAGNVDC